MARTEPFSIRLSALTEQRISHEAQRRRSFPGIAFRGSDWNRRPWVIGTALDVWEIVAASRRFLSPEEMAAGTDLSERQIRLALACYQEFPNEVDSVIQESETPLAQLQREYPTIDTITAE